MNRTVTLVSLSVAGLAGFIWINFGAGIALPVGALIALVLVGGVLGHQSWVAARHLRARVTVLVQFLSLHHRKLLDEPNFTERETIAMSLSDHRDYLAGAMDTVNPVMFQILSRKKVIPEAETLTQVLRHLDALAEAVRGTGQARADHELDHVLRLLGQDTLREAIAMPPIDRTPAADNAPAAPVADPWGSGF